MAVLWDISRALVVRLMFLAHSVISVWKAVESIDSSYAWVPVSGILLQLGEGAYTLVVRKGQERKWWSPGLLLYLLTVVPAVWLMELQRINIYFTAVNNGTEQSSESVETELTLFQTTFTLRLREEEYILAIIDSLLLLLIIGRWLLPRKGLSNDQLSLLLLIYVAIASDIMELFVLFEEDYVIMNDILVYITLTVWTVSLTQFIIVLTAIKGSHTPEAMVVNETGIYSKTDPEYTASFKSKNLDKGSETAAIIFALVVQDIPFLCLRLYVLITYRTLSYNIIFFSLKNILVITAQSYRVFIVLHRHVKTKSDFGSGTLPRNISALSTLPKNEGKTESVSELNKITKTKEGYTNGNYATDDVY